MASIIFLGDSITAAFPLGALLGDYPIINKGISGDNTDHVLARLDNDVIRFRPDAVFILIGTNDMASGFSDPKIFQNIRTLLSRLQSSLPGAALFLQSILPTRGLENRPLARIDGLNAEIRRIAPEYGARYLDLTPLLAGPDGEIPEVYSEDGLHLTTAAYQRWSEFLRTYISAAGDHETDSH